MWIRSLSFLILVLVLLSGFLPQLSLTSQETASDSTVYFDMVVDDARQLLYGSDQDADEIDVVSLVTLQVIDTLKVGIDPAGLDISPDGKELAVALTGQAEIAFIDIETHQVIARLTPQHAPNGNYPYDVLYGRPGRLYSTGSTNSAFDCLHVYDTNLKTEIACSSEPVGDRARLAMTADHNTIYTTMASSGGSWIYRFDVSTEPVLFISSTPPNTKSGSTICVHPDGRVFSSGGTVFSADLATVVGLIENVDYTETECSSQGDVVYLSGTSSLSVVDAATYKVVYQSNLATKVGVSRLNSDESILYVSTSNGLIAFDTTAYPISGTIRDEAGIPQPGVTVTNDKGFSTTTDEQGNYIFTDIYKGDYTLTPSKEGYVFNPRLRQVSVPPSITGVDFTLIPAQYLYMPCLERCNYLYFDEFSNSTSGWPVSKTKDYQYEYLNGEYHIQVIPVEYGVGVRPGFQASEYTVTVDVRNVTNRHGSYGLAFGIASDWSTMYTLEIYPDGWFGLYRWNPSSLSIMAEEFSPAIRQGSAVNTLKVRRSGSNIEAYANDVLLARRVSDYYKDNYYLGVVAFTYDQRNLDIRYDNFIVYPSICGGSPGALSMVPGLDSTPIMELSPPQSLKRHTSP